MGKRQKHSKNESNKNQTKVQNNLTPGGSGTIQNAATSKRPSLSLQKRNELGGIIASLLELGFKQATNSKEEWQQYLDIQKLLNRVIVIEAPIKRKSANASAAERLANIDNFYKWATDNDIQYDAIKISQFPGYDLGLEATRDIKADEQLISIPRKLMLSEENLENDFRQTQFDSMSNLKLAYAFMLETLKPDSFWKPYIDMLPDTYSTVLYYSVEEMEQLRGSNALSQALRQCKAIARQYAFIYNIAQTAPQQEKISIMGQQFKQLFSYELYRWAVSTIMTRQNMIPRIAATTGTTNGDATAAADAKPAQSETIAALIPFWDMANHKHGQVTSFFNVETNQMESAAQMDFKKGEQIFIHYGNRSNADLMVHNGFINPDNPKDSVAIKLGLSTSDPLYAKRSQVLRMLEISKSGELQLLPAPDYISPQLLGFVRVFNMNSEQLEHWIQSDRAMDLLHIDCALETSLDSKTWQFLETRLMLLLRVFPTTLEDDEKRLAQLKSGELKLDYIPAMILEYRILEKRILLNALDYAKQRTKA